MIENALSLLNNLRKKITRIRVYAPKAGKLEIISSTKQEEIGQSAPPEGLSLLKTRVHRVHREMKQGKEILRIDAPLFSNNQRVAVVSIFSTLIVRDQMMAYLKNLIFIVAPVGGLLILISSYFPLRRIFLSRLSSLSQASKVISTGKWPSLIPVKWQDEMGELEEAFNQMSLSRQKAEEALEDQAIRDPLTKLYNRRYFDFRIREEISRAFRKKTIFAVLICDLDSFKSINDRLGTRPGTKCSSRWQLVLHNPPVEQT